MDLALNNLQRLICHKTQQTKPNIFCKGVKYLHPPNWGSHGTTLNCIKLNNSSKHENILEKKKMKEMTSEHEDDSDISDSESPG